MSKKQSLNFQIKNEFKSRHLYGVSKHNASEDEKQKYIFSSRTLDNYQEVGREFAKFCKQEHQGESQNIEQCKPYAAEYLQYRIERGLSPYTIARDAAALGKLYNCDYREFGVELPKRQREQITRSRDLERNLRGFSEKNNQKAVDMARCTGLRREELKHIKAKDFYEKDGKWFVHVPKTYAKGGRERDVELQYSRNPKVVERTINFVKSEQEKGNTENLVIVRDRMPVHYYRHEFAKAMYENIARDPEDIERSECWCCTKSMYGTVLDREAMAEVSLALGHNRLDVVVGYLTSEIN